MEAEFSRYYELKSKEEVEGAELKVAEKIDTENPKINLTKNLIKRGVDLLKKLDVLCDSVII